MAKKSAKSKGYRKTRTEKPYLSRKEIGVLCAIVALLAVGAFFLFRYDDGALKVQDGAVVTDGDNWLIVDGSNVRGRSRYFKLGEMGDIDGYALEARATMTDANVPQYVFTPATEEGVDSISVSASHSGAKALAEYTMASLREMENVEMGPLQTAEVGERSVSYYVYEAAPTGDAETDGENEAEADGTAEGETDDDAEGETDDESKFTRALSAYFDAERESCIVVRSESRADSLEACLSEEALAAAMQQAVAAVTLETGK